MGEQNIGAGNEHLAAAAAAAAAAEATIERTASGWCDKGKHRHTGMSSE